MHSKIVFKIKIEKKLFQLLFKDIAYPMLHNCHIQTDFGVSRYKFVWLNVTRHTKSHVSLKFSKLIFYVHLIVVPLPLCFDFMRFLTC